MPADAGYAVRRATAVDLPRLPEIEAAAAERFRASAYPELAVAAPLPVEVHAALLVHDGVWLATTATGEVVGFIAWRELDGHAYVLELSVVPAHAGARLGARLLDCVAAVARAAGFSALTLRTFADVAWNAPYYRRLGFGDVDADGHGPGLAAIIRAEAEAGLDPRQRVTLIRSVGA